MFETYLVQLNAVGLQIQLKWTSSQIGFKDFINSQKRSPEVFYKKAVFENFFTLTENTCVVVLEGRGWLQQRGFPVNIETFLRTPLLRNTCEWLLVNSLAKSFENLNVFRTGMFSVFLWIVCFVYSMHALTKNLKLKSKNIAIPQSLDALFTVNLAS